jgi:hypothetical protein
MGLLDKEVANLRKSSTSMSVNDITGKRKDILDEFLEGFLHLLLHLVPHLMHLLHDRQKQISTAFRESEARKTIQLRNYNRQMRGTERKKILMRTSTACTLSQILRSRLAAMSSPGMGANFKTSVPISNSS